MKKINVNRNLLIALSVITFIFVSIIGAINIKLISADAETLSTYNSSSPYLELELVGEGEDYYLIRVTNTTSRGILVEYNEFMCYGYDAEDWTALGHIKTIYLGTSEDTGSYSSKTKDVMVYNFPLTCTHIAFSYVSGDTRYITSADHIDGVNLSLMTYTNSVTVYKECLEISKVEYTGKWKITLYNPNSYSINLEYNTKMCFEEDAKNWIGLEDPGDVKTISAYGSTYVEISENWFATCCAFSFQRNDKRYITYVYDLNKIIPSIMTVKTVIKQL